MKQEFSRTTAIRMSARGLGNRDGVQRRIRKGEHRQPLICESHYCPHQDRHTFHIIKADGLTFPCCTATDTFGSTVQVESIEKVLARGHQCVLLVDLSTSTNTFRFTTSN